MMHVRNGFRLCRKGLRFVFGVTTTATLILLLALVVAGCSKESATQEKQAPEQDTETNGTTDEPIEIDKEQIERLESLGYI